jgi:hypothetical protein
MKYASKFQ